MDRHIIISLKTIFLTLLLLVGFYVVYRLGTIFGILALAFLIVLSIEPLVRSFSSITVFNKTLAMPRSLAVLLAYLLLTLVLVLVFVVGIPPVVSEVQTMVASLTVMAHDFSLYYNANISLADFIPQATALPSKFLTITVSLFSNITSVLSLFIFAIYLSLDWLNIKEKFIGLFHKKTADDLEETINEVEATVGSWVKGELILVITIAMFIFIGLLLLDVKYALALALIAGILEIVPFIGPVISGSLACIIAFADAPIKVVGVIALYVIVHTLENNLVVPKVMEKVSGFSPVIILLAMLIGGEFFGVFGAIVSVPMTMVLAIILQKVLRGQNL